MARPADHTKEWVRRSVTSYSNAGGGGGYGYLWWVARKGRMFTGVEMEDGTYAGEGVGGNCIL